MTTTNENERRLVLEMLKEGKIGIDDAQRLLAKLEGVGSSPEEAESKARGKVRAKHLRIVCTEKFGDDLNLRIPLGLVRAGLTLESFLPSWAGVYVASNFSEFTKLDAEYLRENLDDLDMTIESDDGSTVSIFTE